MVPLLRHVISFITFFVTFVTDKGYVSEYIHGSTEEKPMSELIQNNEEKQKALKNIVKDLSEGSDVKAVQKQFKKIIENVSPEEIAAMEQSMIDGGVPVEHVQSLCDVHVKVFEDTLSKQKTKKPLPGHPVHTYREENKYLRKLIKSMKKEAGRAVRKQDSTAFRLIFDELKKVEIHYARKENQLFPFLETVNFTGPSRVMWGKQDEIRTMIKQIDASLSNNDLKDLKQMVRKLSRALSGMIFMEEKILFPTSLRKLPEQAWKDIRRGESEIGYAWVQPGNLWDPDILKPQSGMSEFEKLLAKSEKIKEQREAQEAAENGESNKLSLQVGEMTLKQINWMLKGLPLDISFVDEHDTVLYYSGSKDRLFPRSPGIIGRKVQNCHPPKSAHIVQKIVDSFKNHEKDKAEFYFTIKDTFVHIRYFPVYDDNNVYRGVIEVSQDITDIRKLEGERKLLNW